MSVTLYYTPISPPCRAVLLTAEAIGLSLDLKHVDLMKGEHLTPEYERLNPQKTVPFLVDGNYKLAESRAIMAYLVDEYGKHTKLYPTDPASRAIVDHRLYFDIGTLNKYLFAYYMPVLFGRAETYNPELLERAKKAFESFELFLDGTDYAAGRNLTIADFSLVVTVSTGEVLGFDISEYKNVSKWMDKVKTTAPGYKKANEEGLEIFRKIVLQKSEERNS